MTKGKRIREQRESANISQTDLAKKCGISKQTLYKYENDIITNIPSDVIEKIADATFCTPAYIMGWEKPLLIECSERLKNLDGDQLEKVIDYISFIEMQKKGGDK